MQNEQNENGQGCKIGKTYPKPQATNADDSLVNLERLEKATRLEGHIGV